MNTINHQITTPAVTDSFPDRVPGPATWASIGNHLVDRAAAQQLIDVAVERHDSPLGTLLLGATAEGLVRVGLPAEGQEAVLEDLARRVSARVMLAPRGILTQARHQFDGYFDRTLRAFAIRLDWRLSAGFRREVLRACAQIPYGQTSTYRQLARQAGSPTAPRAAGTALALNPLPIVVPCHRVLRSDGRLGGYRGGLEAKTRLLELELDG